MVAVIGAFTLQYPLLLVVVVVMTAGAAWVLRERRTGVGFGRQMGECVLWILCWSAPAAWLANQPTWAGHVGVFLIAMSVISIAVRAAYRRRGLNSGGAKGAMMAKIVGGGLALALIARPIWDWTILETRKPELAVLLDDSRSMEIADMPGADGGRMCRAEAMKREVDASVDELAQLEELYVLRFVRFRAAEEAVSTGNAIQEWSIEPKRTITPLAEAMREAAGLVDSDNRKPAAIVAMTDGAETAESDAAVAHAAAAIGRAGIALHTVGCAPEAAESRSIELSPLGVPPRIAVRERVAGEIAGRIRGMIGGAGRLEMAWNGEAADGEDVQIETDDQSLTHGFDLAPPGPGMHRLTATLTISHPAYGEERADVHATVEVVEGRVRVLMLDGAPRTESAFVSRALEGDPRFEVTRRYLPRTPELIATEETADADYWSGFDVVLWGIVPRWRLSARALERLRDEVTQRGVGLLLAGGEEMFAAGTFAGTALEEISPAGFPTQAAREARRVGITTRFTPTETGLSHAVLRLSESPEADRKSWSQIASLAHAASLRELDPLAMVLALDAGGRVVLAAQEAGAGRCIAAGWESTWSWALGSDEGSEIHRTVWRQIVQWLANRRPRAWVFADESTYAWEAVRGGGKPVVIRAGVTGFLERSNAPNGSVRGAASGPASAAVLSGAKMEVVGPDGNAMLVTAKATTDGWEAEYRPSGTGEYRVTFGVDGGEHRNLTATTAFRVTDLDLEMRRPTAKLALLRAAAAATAERGGSYVHISEFGALIRKLADTDRRRRVETRVRYDVVDRHRWSALAAVAALLCAEWLLRKRAGVV